MHLQTCISNCKCVKKLGCIWHLSRWEDVKDARRVFALPSSVFVLLTTTVFYCLLLTTPNVKVYCRDPSTSGANSLKSPAESRMNKGKCVTVFQKLSDRFWRTWYLQKTKLIVLFFARSNRIVAPTHTCWYILPAIWNVKYLKWDSNCSF